jgi:hypothetical protein
LAKAFFVRKTGAVHHIQYPKKGVLAGKDPMANPFSHRRFMMSAAVAGGSYHPARALKSERDAYVVPLKKGTTWIDLTSKL